MSKYENDVLNVLYQHQPEFVSGQFIAEQLKISRTSVKKVIDRLKNDGCEIESIHNKGHHLVNLPDKWYETLVDRLIQKSSLIDYAVTHETVDSTQILAKQALVGNQDTFMVIADEQVKGKGRFNRQWASERGLGLWTSLVLRPNVQFSMITTFNLFMSLAIRDAIQSFVETDVFVKWPNDIYIGDKKVCGFLTEMVANHDGIEAVICGIGINMNQLGDHFDEVIKDKATSIRQHNNDVLIDRYDFLDVLLKNIEHRYLQFLSTPFKDIKDQYMKHSNIWDRTLTFTEGSKRFKGEPVSIDDQGFLHVKDGNGDMHRLMSADIES